jgi:hypothetical protein
MPSVTSLTVSLIAWWSNRCRSSRGQATAEYALVLLAVAAVALALTTWAAGGKVASFLDAVFDRLLASAR